MGKEVPLQGVRSIRIDTLLVMSKLLSIRINRRDSILRCYCGMWLVDGDVDDELLRFKYNYVMLMISWYKDVKLGVGAYT